MKTKRWKRLYGQTVKFVCPYCLKELPVSQATIDHRNPYARFHDNSVENKIMVCKKDNNFKGMLTHEEFLIFLLFNRVRNGKKDKEDLNLLEQIMRVLKEKGLSR